MSKGFLHFEEPDSSSLLVLSPLHLCWHFFNHRFVGHLLHTFSGGRSSPLQVLDCSLLPKLVQQSSPRLSSVRRWSVPKCGLATWRWKSSQRNKMLVITLEHGSGQSQPPGSYSTAKTLFEHWSTHHHSPIGIFLNSSKLCQTLAEPVIFLPWVEPDPNLELLGRNQ